MCGVHSAIMALLDSHEVVVSPRLDDAAFAHDDDHVGVDNGGQPVSDDNLGAGDTPQEVVEGCLHHAFALSVKR